MIDRVEPLVISPLFIVWEKLPESESATNSIQPEKHKEPQNPLTRLTANLKNNICDNKRIPNQKNKVTFQENKNSIAQQGQQCKDGKSAKGTNL